MIILLRQTHKKAVAIITLIKKAEHQFAGKCIRTDRGEKIRQRGGRLQTLESKSDGRSSREKCFWRGVSPRWKAGLGNASAERGARSSSDPWLKIFRCAVFESCLDRLRNQESVVFSSELGVWPVQSCDYVVPMYTDYKNRLRETFLQKHTFLFSRKMWCKLRRAEAVKEREVPDEGYKFSGPVL